MFAGAAVDLIQYVELLFSHLIPRVYLSSKLLSRGNCREPGLIRCCCYILKPVYCTYFKLEGPTTKIENIYEDKRKSLCKKTLENKPNVQYNVHLTHPIQFHGLRGLFCIAVVFPHGCWGVDQLPLSSHFNLDGVKSTVGATTAGRGTGDGSVIICCFVNIWVECILVCYRKRIV